MTLPPELQKIHGVISRSYCDGCAQKQGIIEFNHALLCRDCFQREMNHVVSIAAKVWRRI